MQRCASTAGGAAGGLSPAELLTQLVDLRGQVRTAERERDRERIATSQLMAEVEAKASLMQEQQVRKNLRHCIVCIASCSSWTTCCNTSKAFVLFLV